MRPLRRIDFATPHALLSAPRISDADDSTLKRRHFHRLS